jgi:copper chaperone CopZ
MLKQIFHVTDMHCSNCAMRIEGLEDDLPGVKRVRASYHKQQLEVEYDESKLDGGEIIAAIRKLGYTVGD